LPCGTMAMAMKIGGTVTGKGGGGGGGEVRVAWYDSTLYSFHRMLALTFSGLMP
jgi:hypothetical protein